jgi:2-hydroxychromene-2-carboxylate isomerase
MNQSVEFYFDVGSPASYLAYTQLRKICDETSATLIYRPILLGAVFKATGNASPNDVPAKARYSIKDLARVAKRLEVPLTFNPHFPINTLSLMRALTAVQMFQPHRFVDLMEATFKAIWVDALNLNDLATLSAALTGAGFDPAEVFDGVSNPGVKDRLKTNTDEAVTRGVFGAPSMFVDGELYFGQDRLDFVRDALSA